MPSAVNSAKRGRDPTSTLSTTDKLSVSMKCAMLEVSEVAIRVLPSGLTPDAFRLDPDRNLRHHLPVLEIDRGQQAVVLVGDIDRTARGMNVQLLGIWT